MNINELATRIIVRNDTSANWAAVEETVVLMRGEIGVEFASDMTKVKVGDGETPWKDLAYVTAGSAAQSVAQTWGGISGKTEGDAAGTTERLMLTKPAYTDVIDVAILNANADLIDTKTIELEDDIALLEARLQSLIEGSTPADNVELIDIRTGHDGTTYPTAGDAVRAIGEEVSDLKDNLGDFLVGEMVDGLKYENSQLWLTSGGETVGDPVTITGGGGGTGSDGMYAVTLTNMLDSRIISVAQGENVVLDVQYISTDSEGIDDGAGIGTITVNSVKKASISVAQGRSSIDITNHLSNGLK